MFRPLWRALVPLGGQLHGTMVKLVALITSVMFVYREETFRTIDRNFFRTPCDVSYVTDVHVIAPREIDDNLEGIVQLILIKHTGQCPL